VDWQRFDEGQTTSMTQVCEFLEWDSEFFGIRVARVLGDWLDPQRIAEIESWCCTARVDCLYFLSRCDQYQTARLAEAHGFHWVDVRMTFEYDRRGTVTEADRDVPGPTIIIRSAKESDIPVLRGIARVSYAHSRFYYDERFSRALCDEMYAVWIEKCCHGHSDVVLVAEMDGNPIGYVTCLLDRSNHTGTIDLVAVAAAAAGRGVGLRLLSAAKRWFLENGAMRVMVATQGRNIGAQRLYQRSGFITYGVQLWYHRWLNRENSGTGISSGPRE